MGKGGRACCIAAPWLLTVASFVCLVLIEVAGWNKGTLNSYYFMKANFSDLSISSASTLENTTTLTAALEQAQKQNLLEDVYEIHLWNYCSSSSSNGTMDYCSSRKANFYFDLIDAWGLNATTATAATTTTSSSNNAIESAAARVQNNAESLEKNVLGDAGEKAYTAYKKVAKAMFVLYTISFWTTLATIALGILAIFSRWGSFLTWIFSFASSILNIAAVVVSTALYAALVGALKTLLDPYNVEVSLGTHVVIVAWLSVVFSWAATLFWLFSICCCSGRNNPHHRNNKGGLWNAEEKGMGYGEYAGRGRGVKVEKTGGGYSRVASPFMGHGQGDRVPLNDYPQPTGYQQQTGGAYEPFRHS